MSRRPDPLTRLFVTTSYPRFEGDPAGCFVQARVRAFTGAGGQARVLAAGEPPGPDALMGGPSVAVERIGYAVPGAPALFYGGGAPERLETGGPLPLLQAARLWAGLLAALRAGPAPASIESHWLLPSALAVIAAGPAGVPHQAHAHSGDVALLERLPFGASLARRLLAGAALVFVSADLRARFGRLVGPRLAPAVAACPVQPAVGEAAPPARSPRGVPAAERRALRVRLGLAGPVLIGVGRLVPIKGYDVLVRAVGRLPAAGRPTLVLLGEGPERGRLARMAEQRRVALRLPGEVPRPEVWPWLTAADLFVHPSRRLATGRTEGQPLAVREALHAGLTVIASALGGVEELAATEGSRLHVVPPDDPAALSHLLHRYISETAV